MDTSDTDTLIATVAAGFETLQVEYRKLHGQHQALERKLATTREQVRVPRFLHPKAAL